MRAQICCGRPMLKLDFFDASVCVSCGRIVGNRERNLMLLGCILQVLNDNGPMMAKEIAKIIGDKTGRPPTPHEIGGILAIMKAKKLVGAEIPYARAPIRWFAEKNVKEP